jgi:hypothetical protein
VEKAVMVSIPLVFNFPPPLQFFSQGIFSVTWLFSGLRQLPSPSQSKEQGPATTISTRKVKCYSVAARLCCFSFSFLPLHLKFTMSYVPINTLPAKTYI